MLLAQLLAQQIHYITKEEGAQTEQSGPRQEMLAIQILAEIGIEHIDDGPRDDDAEEQSGHGI